MGFLIASSVAEEPPPSGDFDAVDTLLSTEGWSFTGDDIDISWRHVSNMTSGYGGLPEAPGAAWGYNDYGVGLFGDSLKLVFGGGSAAIDTAAESRIFTPLGFEDGGGFDTRDRNGAVLSPRDFARIGLWWLNQGNWNGSQLLPQTWFTEYFGPDRVAGSLPRTAGGSVNDYLGVGSFGGGLDQSAHGPGIYSFGLWVNGLVAETANRAYPHLPTDAYMADGHFGREVLVIIPSLSIVVCGYRSSPGWGDASAVGDPDSTFNQNLKLIADAVIGAGTNSTPEFPGATWGTSTDAEAGLSTATLDSFIASVAGSGVFTRYGRLVRSWGSHTTPLDIASASKPVLACMLAFAIVEGLVT